MKNEHQSHRFLKGSVSRRKFLGQTAAAAIGFTIIPRQVLGGAGYVAPSEGNAAGDDERMAQLNGLVGTEPIPPTIDAEQTADGIAEFMRVPLWVVCAGVVGVADRDTLYVGFPQEMKHDAQTLGANSNESDIKPLWSSSC